MGQELSLRLRREDGSEAAAEADARQAVEFDQQNADGYGIGVEVNQHLGSEDEEEGLNVVTRGRSKSGRAKRIRL